MSWLSRLGSVIRSDRLNRDLDEEMRFHLDARTEEYTRAGFALDEAVPTRLIARIAKLRAAEAAELNVAGAARKRTR